MGSVERVEYMDNIKVAEVEQTIQKEKEYALSCVVTDCTVSHSAQHNSKMKTTSVNYGSAHNR
jgi:hypothetical protein